MVLLLQRERPTASQTSPWLPTCSPTPPQQGTLACESVGGSSFSAGQSLGGSAPPLSLDSYRVLRGKQSRSSIRRRGECSWEQAGLGQTSSREGVWGVQGPGSLSPSRCLLCARPVLRLCVDCTDWDVSQGTQHPWELAFVSPILHRRNLELCWISTLWVSLSLTAETAWDLRSVLK